MASGEPWMAFEWGSDRTEFVLQKMFIQGRCETWTGASPAGPVRRLSEKSHDGRPSGLDK